MTMSIPAFIAGDDVGVSVPRDLVDAAPVGDHEAVEAKLPLEDIGDQVFLRMHLQAAPAGVRHHDASGARVDRRLVGRKVHGAQGLLVDLGHALVDEVVVGRGAAPGRAAIADEVLRGGQHGARVRKLRPLEAADEGRAELGDELGLSRRSSRTSVPSGCPAGTATTGA